MLPCRFESSVISYGSQTVPQYTARKNQFESSVISYGSQTDAIFLYRLFLFESSVISYGSQTLRKSVDNRIGLRVVLSHMVVKRRCI